MDQIVFESVRKIFRHRPALFNWLGRERGGETIALKDVSFSAGHAEVLVLLGPDGSGKTTALKLISTMLLPDAGSVHVGGFDAWRDAGKVRQQVGIAVAAERSFFPRLSAHENLEFFAALDEVPRSERAQRIKEVLLDAATTAHFWATIRALAWQQNTVLLATHNFAEAAAVADRLLLLHRGELLADRAVGDGESADALRSFYFHMTGEIDEAMLKV